MTIENNAKTIGGEAQEAARAAPMRRSEAALSDTARVLLSAAANRESGALLPPPAGLKARGSALQAVLSRLLTLGLVEPVPVRSDSEVWRRDEDLGRLGLRITAVGCAAIGVEADGDSAPLTEPVREAEDEARPTSAVSPQHPGAGIADNEDDASAAARRFADIGLARLREDDLLVSGEDDAGEGSRTGTGDSPTSRKRSKQDDVIALLSREGAATIEDLMAATGWLPHTVRAVLSGLRKKGHRIDRQKDGAGASVYRIAPKATRPDEVALAGKAS